MSSRSPDNEGYLGHRENRVKKILSGSGFVRGVGRGIGTFSIVVSLATLLLALPAARARQGSDAPPAGNAQNGKKLFSADGCYECHGLQGQGAAQTGAARIGPPQLSFEAFQNYVRKPSVQMPPYSSKAISEQDLADIYAFLKSIPMPPKGKDIPLLNR
jgi:mono/diheme cytochrome c family protein